MKKFKNVIALTLVASLALSFIGCSKETESKKNKSKKEKKETKVETEETEAETEAETTPETTVASETDATTETEPSVVTPSASESDEFIMNHGEQLIPYLNHQYYLNGEAIPVLDTNFYFIDSYTSLCQFAAYYGLPTLENGFIDLSAECSEDGYDTWGDYFVDYAESEIKRNEIMVVLAKENGIVLEDEDEEVINYFFDTTAPEAAGAADVDVETFYHMYYGSLATEGNLRDMFCKFCLVDRYKTYFADNYEVDEKELTVPNLRYALVYAPDGCSDAELKDAEATCQDLLAKCTDLDAFATEAEKARDEGIVYEYGETISVLKGQMVPEFEAWAWDPARKDGDIDMIFTQAYGYFVVGYLGTSVVEEYKDRIIEQAFEAYIEEVSADYELTSDK